MTTRRHFLAFALGATALAPFSATPVLAQAEPIGSIQVVFTPTVLHAWSSAHTALVRAELESTLAELLGPSLRRGAGTRLVIVISSIWFSDFAGGGGGAGKPRDGGSGNDYLESTATLYDRSGRELGSWPIRSTEGTGGGAWYLPDVDQRRLKALARNNAYWVKRYLAG